MSVTENGVNFKSFESIIFSMCCAAGRSLLCEALTQYDLELSASRDKLLYRAKGKRRTTVKTIMGEVEYERNMYMVVNEDGSKRYVYLLDEALGIKGHGFISELLSEFIAKTVCNSSYRASAHTVSELTGQTISHTAAWNVTQQLGERLNKQEETASAMVAKGEGKGKIESAVLFEEMDGIYLKMQGKSRKEHGSSKEMKVAIAYDGAEKTGKERYRLTNKVACANFENVGRFRKRKEGIIASTYNVDEIDTRILNGDGAEWIKDSADEDTHYQLDQFHISQAIIRNVSNEEARKNIRELLHAKQIDLVLDVIDAYSNSTEDQKECENYQKLHSYFQNNREGLIPCHRRGLNLPEPPDGKHYRHLGAMESNIFSIIGNRMKGGRACWSVEGGNNLARLLCLKATGKLTEVLESLGTAVLPKRYTEEIKISAAAIPFSEGRGYNGYHKMSIPSTMPFLKNIAAMRSI